MAKRSSIFALPDEVKTWLDSALMEGNFSGYQVLEETLRDQGYVISKSAIHRYGQKMEKKLAAIKASTEASRIFMDGMDDSTDSLNGAVLAMVQTGLFECLVGLQEANEDDIDPEKRIKLYAGVAKNIANLSQTSINLKKFQSEMKDKIQAAATEVEKLVKRGGLSDDAADEIRSKILGIAES